MIITAVDNIKNRGIIITRKTKNMKYKASFVVEETFEAEDELDAQKQASSWQENIAGSNDGSEILANANFKIVLVEE